MTDALKLLTYPWIGVLDADSGTKKFVPPGGHVAGIYARTDTKRRVFKALYLPVEHLAELSRRVQGAVRPGWR